MVVTELTTDSTKTKGSSSPQEKEIEIKKLLKNQLKMLKKRSRKSRSVRVRDCT